MSFAVKYFTDNTYRYNPANAKRESSILFGCGKFERWMLFPVSILIQLCAGSFYAWSAIASALKKSNMPGFDNHSLPVVFYTCVAFFGVSACLSGPWLERNGPLKPAILGSVLFFVGNVLSGLACHWQTYWLLLLGFGLFCGAGIGMSYLVPVAVLQKWFPHMRGVASGVAVGAFGLGSVLASLTNKWVSSEWFPDTRVLWFAAPGAVYFLLMTPASLLLRFPPPASAKLAAVAVAVASQTTVVEADGAAGAELKAPQQQQPAAPAAAADVSERADAFVKSVFSLNFLFVFAIFFFSVVPGLFYVSRITAINDKVFGRPDATLGSTMVALAGLFNVAGRALFGVASDKLGRVAPLTAAGVLQLAMVIGLTLVMRDASATSFNCYRAFVWLVLMSYGASVGLVPGLLSDCFGLGIVGTLYGITLLAWSGAGLCAGLVLKHLISDDGADFAAANYTLAGFSAVSIALILAFAVRLRLQRRRSPPSAGSA